MRCRRVRKLLVPFLSGELPPSTEAEIEQHLSHCADCAAERDLLVESWDMLGDYEPPEVRGDFTSSLMQRIRAEQRAAGAEKIVSIRPVPAHARWRLVAAAAACLVIALTVGLLLHRSRALRGPDGRPSPDDIAIVPVTDEEIIRDLELYENADMLADLELFGDLDVIEEMDDSALPATGGA